MASAQEERRKEQERQLLGQNVPAQNPPVQTNINPMFSNSAVGQGYQQQYDYYNQLGQAAQQYGNKGILGNPIQSMINKNGLTGQQVQSDWNRKGVYEDYMNNQMQSMPNYGSQIGTLLGGGYNPSQSWDQYNQYMNQMGNMANMSTGGYYNQNPMYQFQYGQQGMGGQQGYNPMMMNPQSGGQSGTGQPQVYGAQNPYAPQGGGQQGGGQGGAPQSGQPWNQNPQQPSAGGSSFQPLSGVPQEYAQNNGGQSNFQQSGDYLNNYLGQNDQNLGINITQPNVGNTPQLPDYNATVSGNTLSGTGQTAQQALLGSSQNLLNTPGALDTATRQALLAPAQAESKKIAEQQMAALMDRGKNLGLNTEYLSKSAMDVAQSAANPLIQAEADIVNKGLDRQLQQQQLGLGGLQNLYGQESQTGLAQKELNLGAATQAGNFSLGQGTFNLNKGQLNLDAQQVEQNGRLTANGQRIQEQLGKAGLDLDKYKTDQGYNLEQAKFDFSKEMETRGMNLQERMQASDEFYKGLGMSMEAQDRDFQRQQTMAEMAQSKGQWDDEQTYKYKSLELEGALQAAGIDSTNARWAGELAANILSGREQLDQEKWMFLKNLDAQSGGSIFGSIFGSVAGSLLGGVTGGISTAVGGAVSGLLGGGGSSSSSGGGNPGGYFGNKFTLGGQ